MAAVEEIGSKKPGEGVGIQCLHVCEGEKREELVFFFQRFRGERVRAPECSFSFCIFYSCRLSRSLSLSLPVFTHAIAATSSSSSVTPPILSPSPLSPPALPLLLLIVKYELPLPSPRPLAASASAREIAAARPSGVCVRSLRERSWPHCWSEGEVAEDQEGWKRAVRTTRPKIVPGDLFGRRRRRRGGEATAKEKERKARTNNEKRKSDDEKQRREKKLFL